MRLVNKKAADEIVPIAKRMVPVRSGKLRASIGSTATTHSDSSTVRLYKGGYNIVGDSIFFTNPPRGTNVTERDDSNRDRGRASFSGRVFLRQDYSSNAIFDDVSHEFTGIAQTFRTSISGVNTTGLTTGSSFLTIKLSINPPFFWS